MNPFGIINIAGCVNVEDPRCSDPAFALNNPTICAQAARLIIKPSVAVTCPLGSIQFRAFSVLAGVETDVTDQAVFSTGNPDVAVVAVVGASSGNATALSDGEAKILATFDGITAEADLTVLAGNDCCSTQTAAMLILIDCTKSMGLTFGGSYGTKLGFAKSAAKTFIGRVNGGKDSVAVYSFTDTSMTLRRDFTHDMALASASVDAIAQTTDSTGFSTALTQAIGALDAETADRKIVILISDGEDENPNEKTSENDPFVIAELFKSTGGVIMCLGVRSSTTANGFAFLSALSSGGFFINATLSTATDATNFLSGLLGYVCGGDCTPAGDVVEGQGALDFNSFVHWGVTGGTVDLVGNGFFDLLPGNGLYVDLGGTTAPNAGLMTTFNTFHVTNGEDYSITLKIAGNQVDEDAGAAVRISVVGSTISLIQDVYIPDFTDGFADHTFSFTATADDDVTISIQQTDLTPVVLVPPTPTPSGSPVTTFTMITGTGSPEGVVTAGLGQMYWDTAGHSFWIKNTATGNTGWEELIG